MKPRPSISWLLISVCLVGFVYRFDFYGLSMSLPAIARYFSVSTDTISLLYMMYLVVVAGGLLIAGRIEDKIGLRNAFTLGFLIFSSGGALSALSWNEPVLIICRSVQGAGTAFLISSAYATVSQHFEKDRTVAIFGYIAISSELGIMVGCPAGGILSEWFSWRGIFMADALLGLTGAFAVWKGFSIISTPAASRDQRPIDIVGSILWFFSVGILLFALNKGHRLGWTSMLFWSLIGVSIILAILFIIREKSTSNPIFPLGMLGGIKGVAALIIGVLVFNLIAGNAFLMPFFLENIKSLSSSEVGGMFLFFSLAAAIFSFLAGRLARRFKQRNLITIALLVGSLACIGFYFAMSLNGLVPVIIFLILLGIMVGLFIPNNNSLIMGLAPEGKKGVYSGIYDTFNNIGLAAGACIFEVVFAGKTDHILQTVQDKISSKNWMLPGFLDSYFLATVICVIGFLISLWLIKMKPTTGIITNSKKMVKPAIFHTFDNPKNMCTRNQQTL